MYVLCAQLEIQSPEGKAKLSTNCDVEIPSA